LLAALLNNVAAPRIVTAAGLPEQTGPLTAAQEGALERGRSFRECENCPEMVVVPAGKFTMGSPADEKNRYDDEDPQHDVTIGKAFAVGRTHVTVDQFDAFVRETGYVASSKCYIFERGDYEEQDGRSWRSPGFEQEGSHPVVCVSWNDAMAYVDWIAKKTGKPYRLLSEAEFEYAARGQTSPGAYPGFWFGSSENDLCRNGNGPDQQARNIPETSDWTFVSCDDGFAYTSPGGHFAPNAFGLYDMAGNAWQWLEDCWHDDYEGAPADGSAWTAACHLRDHVVRGGAWDFDPKNLRAAYRGSDTDANSNVGFRVARTLM
jgi:formylglycine-generating enzyme required for sulfatase activity